MRISAEVLDVAGALERCEFRVMTSRRAKEFDETIEVA